MRAGWDTLAAISTTTSPALPSAHPGELFRAPGRLSDQDLLEAYGTTRDPRLREELVRRFLPFARKLALRYRHSPESIDDLAQVASLGLLKAIERFEPGRGHRFTSFAAPTILGELKRHFRDKGWSIHVPRDLQERALLLSRTTERLVQDNGRPPTMPELAEAMKCSLEQVLEAHEVARNYEAASLDAPVTRDGDASTLVELLGREEHGFDLAEQREGIRQTWSELSDVERRVVTLRCVHDLTQREIAQHVGYSQMHVSRLLRRSVARLIETPEPV